MSKKMISAAAEALERRIIEGGVDVVEKYQNYLDIPTAPAVENAYDRYALARLLESTEKVLTKEALQTTTVFGANYVKSMLGMTRQIWPRMFGQRLVSVQPVDRPTGQIFHLTVTRDDDTTFGIRPQDDASSLDHTKLQTAENYADHLNGEGGAIDKGMKLTITSSDISVNKVKKLKTQASWELMTDLSAYHNLNAMDILQGAAVDEISQELDALIVAQVRAAAIAHHTVTFGSAPAGYPVDKWPSRLQRAILNADRQIWRASLRRPNVMVCGVDAYTELVDLNGFVMRPNADFESGNYGLVPVGSLNGQYEVMLSRHIPDNEIILGRRGTGFLDAGIVFAPYVALFITDRFFDVHNHTTTQSFASRFDIMTISNTLYARVVLDDTNPGITEA